MHHPDSLFHLRLWMGGTRLILYRMYGTTVQYYSLGCIVSGELVCHLLLYSSRGLSALAAAWDSYFIQTMHGSGSLE